MNKIFLYRHINNINTWSYSEERNHDVWNGDKRKSSNEKDNLINKYLETGALSPSQFCELGPSVVLGLEWPRTLRLKIHIEMNVIMNTWKHPNVFNSKFYILSGKIQNCESHTVPVRDRSRCYTYNFRIPKWLRSRKVKEYLWFPRECPFTIPSPCMYLHTDPDI